MNSSVSVFKGCATTELFNRLYKIAYIRQGELFPKRWVLDHWESLHSPNKISWPAFLFLGNISRNEYLRNLLFTKNRTKCLQLCRNRARLTHSEVESITQDCINTVDSQICIASETSFDMPGANYVYRNEIVIFGGENVEASTFVVKTDNEAELQEQFEQWNTETISSWYNYQKIAIHITSTHFIEPKNSENLFNEVFNDVKLTTRYLSNNSASSVLSSCDGFQRGSIYAII
ncbi:hypothetical protein DINM_002923, partial [Dirofilaria immitis]|nr:hypothetical protein [Dirofilaria immitis]